jgi:uncharacterized protein YbjT (DUF2867 family)
MFIIVGGTGHIGSATAECLLEQRQPVTVVTRSASKGELWRNRGAEVAIADVHDVDRMRAVFRRGRRAFLLNPPANPSGDTDQQERQTVRCLLAALDGSGLENVVALSTYGARPGEACGDLTVLYGFEEALQVQPVPAVIVRAAYLMSNWDEALEPARQTGELLSMLPADLKIPMVAPEDVGRVAARLLQESLQPNSIHHAEGPHRYSPRDAAVAFAEALGRRVEVAPIPGEDWERTFKSLGFSDAAARSYACMTRVTVDAPALPPSSAAIRGTISLSQYIHSLTHRS